jgi:hypothetical protein
MWWTTMAMDVALASEGSMPLFIMRWDGCCHPGSCTVQLNLLWG